VSTWIAYGYNCTEGSLFSGLHRLPPGSAVAFESGRRTETAYAEFDVDPKACSQEEAIDELHEIVGSTLKTIAASRSRLTLALSGGFDSRYLLGLSLSFLVGTSIECGTVSYSEEEGKIARDVSEALGFPLFEIRVPNSIWELYDEIFHFTHDGFPISKNVSYLLAQKFPERPIINGYLGDSLMRGSHDAIRGKYETQWTEDLANVIQRRHLITPKDSMCKWFGEPMATRILANSRLPMEKAVQRGSKIGKVFAWSDLYHRQRFYISNNFLQHVALTEALLPFYSWKLLAFKMEHDYRLFNREIYERLFEKHFPKLAKIPHASDLRRKKTKSKVATITRRWARELLPTLCSKNRVSLLSKPRCIPTTVAGILGHRRTGTLMFLFHRVHLLEQRVRDAGLEIDWQHI
jgi:asparagine synthetase B (glutamine-hydrolysing)